MDSKLLFVTKLLFSILTLHLLSSSSMAQSPVSLETVCNFTQHPDFCKSVLENRTANIYDHTRFIVLKSIYQTYQFNRLVNHHLQSHEYSLSSLEIAALEDCRVLVDLNIDYLTSASRSINSTCSPLSNTKIDDVHTLLSAILANQHTCLEGLEWASSSGSETNSLLELVSNDVKLFGVSLSLFAKSWVPKKVFTRLNNHRRLNQHIPLMKISSLIRRDLYKPTTRRKLQQASYAQNNVLVREAVTVSQDGTGNFTTINEAIDAAPINTAASEGYFVIYVKAGVYEEYVSIGKDKKYLMMIGDGIDKTIITGNRNAVDGQTTFYSATFAVVGSGFCATDITFRNTAGPMKDQAVAVRNGADKSIFYRTSIEGYQDTLYSHSFRQFYRECDIYGTIDFIFGSSAVVFENCNLYARLPKKGQTVVITAQGRTHPEENSGTSILNCVVKAAHDLASSKQSVKTFLGRPWKDYSRTVYIQTYMESIVDPAGWQTMGGDSNLRTLYFAEFNNTGPGSKT